MAYHATVCRVTVRPHPNADRLQIADAMGNRVIVGMDVKDGDLGVFFPVDGQLSEEFANANNLVRRKDPVTGEYTGGFFEENRRVKALKLRGVRSDGFWMPLNCLDLLQSNFDMLYAPAANVLKEGDTLTEHNHVPVCNKYMTPATIAARAKNAAQAKKDDALDLTFPRHYDTDAWRTATDIPTHGMVVVTEKLHGTSGRYGNVPVSYDKPWYARIIDRVVSWLGYDIEDRTHEYKIGTRRTVLADGSTGFYGDESFRREAVKGITLKPGEILYYELVGYTTTNAPIMADQENKLPELKAYGPKMHYAYGCKPGECKLYVYRITQDGRELGWFELARRCRELGLDHVPVLEMSMFRSSEGNSSKDILSGMLDGDVIGPSTLDSTHIREGVCIRIENEHGVKVFKHKSWEFGFLEGYIKDRPDYIDTEESA